MVPGLWKHPKKQDRSTELAQSLDKSGFYAMSIAHTRGRTMYTKAPVMLYLVRPMSAVTRNLIFCGHARNRTRSHADSLSGPFSQGHMVWNIVTSYSDDAARNHELNEQIPHYE
ncbi:Nitrilotriacetate monooxygenase component A/pristinamycin IIA synthase subunit A [Penicillium chrysogenum]|uniref:Nitrilotriacetate monooxygenase component A/pristinamycin IIA synthase subunit A n=1 Tax=Penicillium chrysogenum TaxID=5076 RepID=UPI00238DF82A|nr:Nitrilotriacetate monooxygenase component A/pristinamycin IIA synthase subunit A [Penicillium chrysogenum]KAJ5236980.1 Nitrilotriacetate monooxygenase component A/pristinamycin IIA synthase subunit A [Penicillium chrysogenum]KAJ5276943.1 Nitrilotriacetate monooxygenase component A/pristinamycin IIA synthase subunit A [Penicillium chrysogenum]